MICKTWIIDTHLQLANPVDRYNNLTSCFSDKILIYVRCVFADSDELEEIP